MTLDVEVPEPPDLTNRGVPDGFQAVNAVGVDDEFRREGLESALRDGAWQEAFDEWAEYTDLTEDQFEAIRDRGFFREFDLFWDPEEERLRATTPTVPETDAFDTDTVDAALSDLADTVLEMLDDAYAEYWSDEAEDVVWDESTFGQSRDEIEDERL
jgi:hypothetical protein